MLVILPTIDAEGVHGWKPFEKMMLGDVGSNENYGAVKIAEIFNSFGVSATFFLDVYEASLYGEEPLKKVCHQLSLHNQDIQLHTHPSWRNDPCDFEHIKKLKREKSFFPQKKDFMFKCTLEEQIKILEYGVEKLESWTGKRPIAHRAGGYGINQDTISALEKVGIPIDSSMNYGHENSKLKWKKNQISCNQNIVEIPITGFQRHQNILFLIKQWERIDQFRKTSIHGCSLNDLIWFVDEANRNNNLNMMNLFMHSYSLLKFDTSYSWFLPNKKNKQKLVEFLQLTIDNPNIQYMNMKEFWAKYKNSSNLFFGNDYIPQRHFKISGFNLAATKAIETIITYLHRMKNIAINK